jgi:hypothetical protein
MPTTRTPQRLFTFHSTFIVPPARPSGWGVITVAQWTLSVQPYAQGRTLRQIGAEPGVPWTAVSHQLRRAGLTMRRGGPPARSASTDQILDLRDQGLTWSDQLQHVRRLVKSNVDRQRSMRQPILRSRRCPGVPAVTLPRPILDRVRTSGPATAHPLPLASEVAGSPRQVHDSNLAV